MLYGFIPGLGGQEMLLLLVLGCAYQASRGQRQGPSHQATVVNYLALILILTVFMAHLL